MKKILFLFFLIAILVSVFFVQYDSIVSFVEQYVFFQKNVTIGEKNPYWRDYNFHFVQNTEQFVPGNFQDILNIFYTVLNAGKSEFTFYCPKEYEDCLNHIQTLANDQDLLSNINNFVHPFNGFSHIETEYDTLGRVTIHVIHNYNQEEIQIIQDKILSLMPELTSSTNSQRENIRNIHDYIINHTQYDSDRVEHSIVEYHSSSAYGPLFEGYAICGGYTDLMELFLEELDIPSFKISSDTHVWNVVYVDGDWYHLDLTWDDPVSSDGKNYLEHDYFLIDTPTLLSQEVTQHNFDLETYAEVSY